MFRINQEAIYQRHVLAEQKKVQRKKLQSRLLFQYDNYIFLDSSHQEPRSSTIQDLLSTYFQTKISSLEDLFSNLVKLKKEPIHWVEMGGGMGLAMRQVSSFQIEKNQIEMTNVDLFNHMGILTKEEKNYLTSEFPEILLSNFAPQLIKSNVETVTLKKPADVITSVETIQYLNNPLLAICNWYNQLADDGFLIISTEHTWSSWIRYEGNTLLGDNSPIKNFLKQLRNHQIEFAISESSYQEGTEAETSPDEFKNMIIQKKPNTRLILKSPVQKIWINPHSYKAVYYENNELTIEVSNETEKVERTLKQGYYQQINNILLGKS